MSRLKKIIEKLVSLSEKKENKSLKFFWEGCLVGDDKFIRGKLEKGNLSRFYSYHSNKSIFTPEEHNLIIRLILEIEHYW